MNNNSENKTKRSFLYKRKKPIDNNQDQPTPVEKTQSSNNPNIDSDKIFNFQDMKKMPLAELVVMGQEMNIENADTMLKQNLMI